MASAGIGINRRTLLVGAALAAPFVSRSAFGQQTGEIIQANFGGGLAEEFTSAYGKPFTGETGIPFRVVEVPSTETALISGKDDQQFNSSYHSYSGALKLHGLGVTEALAIEDFPVLQGIPEEYWPKIDERHVAGIPVHFCHYGIAYNSNEAKVDDFRSWNSLVDKQFSGRVTATRPVYASLYDVPWYAKMLKGSQGETAAGIERYSAVVSNALTAYTSMAQNHQLLQRGEAVACAYYSDRVWSSRKGGDETIQIVIPEEGALMIPYVMVIPKGCPHPEAARNFANYAGGAAPAQRAVEGTGCLPLHEDAKVPEELVKQRLGLTMKEILAKTYNPDWKKIQLGRDALIAQLEKELAGKI